MTTAEKLKNTEIALEDRLSIPPQRLNGVYHQYGINGQKRVMSRHEQIFLRDFNDEFERNWFIYLGRATKDMLKKDRAEYAGACYNVVSAAEEIWQEYMVPEAVEEKRAVPMHFLPHTRFKDLGFEPVHFRMLHGLMWPAPADRGFSMFYLPTLADCADFTFKCRTDKAPSRLGLIMNRIKYAIRETRF